MSALRRWAACPLTARLTFSNNAYLKLTTEWIMLHGELAIGSVAAPHTRKATITDISGNTITLDKKLEYMHFGKITFDVDERGEEGLRCFWCDQTDCDLMTLFRIRLRSKGHHDAQRLLQPFVALSLEFGHGAVRRPSRRSGRHHGVNQERDTRPQNPQGRSTASAPSVAGADARGPEEPPEILWFAKTSVASLLPRPGSISGDRCGFEGIRCH